MNQLKEKILEARERRREQASKGWSRLFYMLILLLLILLLLYKASGSKFNVFWDVFQPNQTEEVQEK